MKPALAIRDKAQAPLTTADAQRAQNMEAGNVAESGAAHIAASPVTPREQFQAGTQIAETAAGQPLAVANTRANAVTDAAAINAQGRVDAAKETAKGKTGGAAGGSKQVSPANVITLYGRVAGIRVPNESYNPNSFDPNVKPTRPLNPKEIGEHMDELSPGWRKVITAQDITPTTQPTAEAPATQPTADDGRDRIPQAAAPTTQPSGTTLRPTPQATAQQAMQAAGGDHQKARQILAQNGYDANDIR
jgi:hypothetical protein